MNLLNKIEVPLFSRGQNAASSLELKELQDKNYKHKLEIASKNEQIAQIKITTEKEERRKKDMDSS